MTIVLLILEIAQAWFLFSFLVDLTDLPPNVTSDLAVTVGNGWFCFEAL